MLERQNDLEERARRASRGTVHTLGTPLLLRLRGAFMFRLRSEVQREGADKEASRLQLGSAPSRWTSERASTKGFSAAERRCLRNRSSHCRQREEQRAGKVLNWAGSTLAAPHFGPENGVHRSEPVLRALLLDARLLRFDTPSLDATPVPKH